MARDLRFRVAGAAGEVNILRGVRPDHPTRRGGRAGRAFGFGQDLLLMLLAGLEKPTGGTLRVAGQRSRRDGRGCAGAVPARSCRHRVPGLPPDPDHDGAGKCRGAARISRPSGTPSSDRRGSAGLGRARPPSRPLSGTAVGRRAAAGGDGPRDGRRGPGHPRRRTDRQSRPETGQAIMELLFRLQRERSTTLLLVTHDHALARRCDRVLEVRDGRIAAADRRGGC